MSCFIGGRGEGRAASVPVFLYLVFIYFKVSVLVIKSITTYFSCRLFLKPKEFAFLKSGIYVCGRVVCGDTGIRNRERYWLMLRVLSSVFQGSNQRTVDCISNLLNWRRRR